MVTPPVSYKRAVVVAQNLQNFSLISRHRDLVAGVHQTGSLLSHNMHGDLREVRFMSVQL